MPLINLTHVLAIGSTACRLAAEIARRREGFESPNELLDIVPIDSDSTTIDELPDGLQERFLLLPAEREIADRAARNPDDHPWTHLLNDPRTYEPPRKGLGFQHQPRSCLIALTSASPVLREHVNRWRRHSLGQLRSEGREGVQLQERNLILFEPYGATGWGWLVLACVLRAAEPSSRIDAMMTLPDPAVAGEASLLEYQAKAHDFWATMRAADAGELRLHPELDSFPIDLLLVANPGRCPEVGSFADHASVLTADVMALLDSYAHFETQWINCHQLNLSERIYQPTPNDRRMPKRLVPFGAVTYRHDSKVVSDWLEDRASRAVAGALCSTSGDLNLQRFVQRVVGRFDQVLERQRQLFHRDRDLGDWIGSAGRQNLATKRLQLGPAIQGLQREARRALAEISASRDDVLQAIALDASMAVVSQDLATSSALLDRAIDGVQSRLQQHESDVKRAEELFARRAAVASPSEIQEAFRSSAQVVLQLDVLRGITQQLEDLRELLGQLKAAAAARLSELERIAGREAAPLTVPGLGEEPIVTERLLEGESDPLVKLACTEFERAAPTRVLLATDTDARQLLVEHARKFVSDLATRTASEWARLRFTSFNQRDAFVREVAGRLNHVDLLPVPGVPAQKHLWVAADEGFSAFRDELVPHIGGRLNNQGKQPSRVLSSDGRGSRLVFLSVWLGIAPEHLAQNHDPRVVKAWRAMRAGGFGFAVTAQQVPQLPKPEIPEPRHVPPPPPATIVRDIQQSEDTSAWESQLVQQANDWFVRECLEELRRIDDRPPRNGKRIIN